MNKTRFLILMILIIISQSMFVNAQTPYTDQTANLSTVDWTAKNGYFYGYEVKNAPVSGTGRFAAIATTGNWAYNRWQSGSYIFDIGINSTIGNRLEFRPAGLDGYRSWIDNSGNWYFGCYVGIGTASPSSKLSIGGGQSANEDRLNFLASDNSARFSIQTDLASSTSDDILKLRSFANDNILVFKGNGNLGIGTTDPVRSPSLLDDPTLVVQIGDGVKKPELRLAGPNSVGVSSKIVFDNSISGDGLSMFFTSNITPYGPDGLVFWDENTGKANVKINRDNGNLGIGTTSPDYKLDVIGTIRAQEVKVDMEGADFVFEDDYNLQSLSDVEDFIKENKHLPDIAPAKEMQKNGISVGEMDAKLLQKIEELMLHTINQQTLIESQMKRIEILEKQINN